MPTYEPFDWYQTPVYYDLIFDAGTEQEAAFLEQCHALHARTSLPPKPAASAQADAAGSRHTQHTKPLNILEPACGSGRLMAELATRGHRVAGIDLSEGMLAFARKRFKQRGVKGKLINAPMQDFDLRDFPTKRRVSAARNTSGGGGFDLAHILVSSFKYLQNEQDAADCLRCVCDHLRVGGVFVLGLHLTDPEDKGRSLERWRVSRNGLDVICTVRSGPADLKQRTEPVRSRIVARTPGSPHSVEPKRYETNWHFRTYTVGQLRALLRKEPRFTHRATYTFHHDTARRIPLDGDDLGVVLVLRRER